MIRLTPDDNRFPGFTRGSSAISRRRFSMWHSLFAAVLLVWSGVLSENLRAATNEFRIRLVQAVLSDDFQEQTRIIEGLVGNRDDLIQQALTAWRGGSLYVLETNDTKVPILLDPQVDTDGNAKGMRLIDGEWILESPGKPVAFVPSELTAADASSKLRKVIKDALELMAMNNPDPGMRRDAIVKLGQAQELGNLPHLGARLEQETIAEVRKALVEAIALTRVASPDKATRIKAIQDLGGMRSINSLTFLKAMSAEAKKDPAKFDAEVLKVLRDAIVDIEDHIAIGNLVGTAFRGLSLSAVLLVAALGLAITFGLMGVINMAHGEVMMVGAYTAYVTQNLFARWFGNSGLGFDLYFLVALVTSFLVGGLVGLGLERGVIRFLYKRPLESLLATWGVSLVLQQLFRHIFGAANVQVSSPRWLSGSWVYNDVLFAYNRLFVILIALGIVFGTWLLLTRTSLGLQIRAVMQNRAMASCVGVRTDRVNMMTFGFGSGLAGLAGACLSQIGNVGPSLGQNYIIDCFMVVVLGGVGNLPGTVSASLGVGVTDQILQPWLGAVLGKITVLAAIILFLQWRPAGLFVTRSRSLEG